ncbi:hypothetical protein CH063_13787, partial [Colletotrichum higginsianum]
MGGSLYRWTRVRTLVLTFIIIVFLVYILDAIWLHPRTETAMLERHMNAANNAATPPPPPVSPKSSFDWSAVKFKYPPQTPLTP